MTRLTGQMELVTAQLHEDIYNTNIQGKVSEFGKALEEIKNIKARRAQIQGQMETSGG